MPWWWTHRQAGAVWKGPSAGCCWTSGSLACSGCAGCWWQMGRWRQAGSSADSRFPPEAVGIAGRDGKLKPWSLISWGRSWPAPETLVSGRWDWPGWGCCGAHSHCGGRIQFCWGHGCRKTWVAWWDSTGRWARWLFFCETGTRKAPREILRWQAQSPRIQWRTLLGPLKQRIVNKPVALISKAIHLKTQGRTWTVIHRMGSEF